MKTSKRLALSLLAGVWLAPAGTGARIPFELLWSGSQFGNGATAAGWVMLDDAVVRNPGWFAGALAWGGFTDLIMTVTGAGTGDGTFTSADFGLVIWDTGGARLDLTAELVGQPTAGSRWGTVPSSGEAGEFNLFRASPEAPKAS